MIDNIIIVLVTISILKYLIWLNLEKTHTFIINLLLLFTDIKSIKRRKQNNIEILNEIKKKKRNIFIFPILWIIWDGKNWYRLYYNHNISFIYACIYVDTNK